MTPYSPLDARRRSFYRKIAYVVAICVLLMPLFWLSHPATRGSAERKGRGGGVLAQFRENHGLSQTQLGEIDLTSETIKLSTLGMRGIAVQVLWHKANTYQMKKNWTALRATLEQLSKLQPHFTSVWMHQAWNISYNVSVAFDDYRDKFYWIVEGIKYLQQGIRYNSHEPRLPRDVGRFITWKIGKHDDARLMRRLFEEEPYFGNGRGDRSGRDSMAGATAPGLPPNPGVAMGSPPYDNWLVGKAWLRESETVFEEKERQHGYGANGGLGKVMLFSEAPLAQVYYAEALEKEGRFGGDAKTGAGGVAQRAWATAAKEWRKFGECEFRAEGEITYRLGDLDRYQKQLAENVKALEALAPGLREQLHQKKLAALKKAEREAITLPDEQRTPEQHRLAKEVKARLRVTNKELARAVTGEHARQARELEEKIQAAEELASYTRLQRKTVNYEFWQRRTELEQTAEAIAARKAIYEGDQALRTGQIKASREAFERGFRIWRKILDEDQAKVAAPARPKEPDEDQQESALLLDDRDLCDDLVEAVQRYRKAVDQDDGKFPDSFILQDVLEKHGATQPKPAAKKASEADKGAKK